MMNVLSVENMRKSDAATITAGVPGRELMERAAHAIFESGVWEPPIAIICGSGNNAGDGYALALILKETLLECTVFCIYDKFSEDGKYYYDKCVEQGVNIVTAAEIEKSGGLISSDLAGFNSIVDCLLGTGFRGEVRPELIDVMDAINGTNAFVTSVDINSGLNGDTGMASHCVLSNLTISIGCFKPGHFLNMAKDVMQEKTNRTIGIEPVDKPYKLIEQIDVKEALGGRRNFSNKGTYGYAALIGGSTRYSGSIRLAFYANSAMRSGAGVVKVAVPSSLSNIVSAQILESTLFPLTEDIPGNAGFYPDEIDELISNVRTVAFGMGIGLEEGASQILVHLLKNFKGTLIVDADGLTLLSRLDRKILRSRKEVTVLTPHLAEFARLTGLDKNKILSDPIGIAKEYASDTGTIVLLKGPSTIITDGDTVYISDRGCPGMATAGSGDVLSGVIAATCSYMDDKCFASAIASYINGRAGEIAAAQYGDVSMIASDTAFAIADAVYLCQM